MGSLIGSTPPVVEDAKQAFAQTVIREDNARQAARRAKRKGGARE